MNMRVHETRQHRVLAQVYRVWVVEIDAHSSQALGRVRELTHINDQARLGRSSDKPVEEHVAGAGVEEFAGEDRSRRRRRRHRAELHRKWCFISLFRILCFFL